MCTRGDIKDVNGTSPINTFGTEQVGFIPYEPKPDGANANGVIVSTSIHPGAVPKMTAYVENGRVVRLEGGGEVSGAWMRDFERGKNASAEGRETTFGVAPGPGINWLEEVMYGVHPRSFRLGHSYRYQGSEAFQAWVGGTRRSGVLHFGFGVRFQVGAQRFKHAAHSAASSRYGGIFPDPYGQWRKPDRKRTSCYPGFPRGHRRGREIRRPGGPSA